MKTLLAHAVAAAALLIFAVTGAHAGGTSRSSGSYHSHDGNSRYPILSHYRPVRYVSSRAVYGWVPNYGRLCGFRTPLQVYNYGYGTPVGRYHTYPSVRCYNVYRNYPTSRAISGFGAWR